jgi:hypothetical protein
VSTQAHVFVETNFLFGVFRMPSKRHRDALALKARFDAGEVRLYIPYVCFQEARNLIAKSLPSNRCADLLEFHRHAGAAGNANWDFAEVRKFLDAAAAEVSRTKATYRRDLEEFVEALGEGVLHATKEVFDFLEAMELDDDSLKYNDKLILCSSLVKASALTAAAIGPLYFASVDKSDLQPTVNRPKMTALYQSASLEFVPNFVVPAAAAP